MYRQQGSSSTGALRVLLTCLSGFLVSAANLQTHDASFQPDVVLRISKINAQIACTERETVVVNGTTPGPLVTLTAGETTWIRVYNDMPNDNATTHWHGLSQSVAPFSDGTPLASQWPIPPNHFFDYEVHPNENEAGSYFYHSHVQFQTVSASGPLVVQEPDGKPPPYQYDDERIVFLSELYNRTDESIFNGLIGAPFVWSGEPESLLVNGQSIPAPNATMPGSCAPEVIEVEPSKTYRLRFIGGVALADIILAMEDHSNLTVIGADGAYTKPATTDRMQVDSGQRFEVLLQTKSMEELNKDGKMQTDYWIQYETRYRPAIETGYALLRYKTDSPCICPQPACYVPGTARSPLPSVPPNPPNLTYLLPPDTDNNTNEWLEYALTPLSDNDFPSDKEVSRRIYLTNVQLQYTDGQIPFEVNNHSWVAAPLNSSYRSTPDDRPYLVDIYQQGQSAVPSIAGAQDYFTAQQQNGSASLYTGWDPKANAYPAQIGEVLEIILLNQAGYQGTYDVHPWHAHGGHYYDIGSGPGMYDPDENNARLAKMNADNGFVPALRDSTMLYRWPADNKVNDTLYHVSGWRGWRLRVQDAGVWMIHCHTLQHMQMGMQTVWIMGDAEQITANGNPYGQAFVDPGQNVPRDVGGGMEGYLSYGGSAYGNGTYHPLVNHYFDT